MTNKSDEDQASDTNKANNMQNKPSFYNSFSASGYLTPLQRKQLREKRNLDSSLDNKISPKKATKEAKAKPKTVTKQLKKNLKAKHVVESKRSSTLAPKKKAAENVVKLLMNSKYTPPTQGNNSDLKRRIFVNRSPGRFKRANFSMALTWKKKLSFSLKSLSPRSNSTQYSGSVCSPSLSSKGRKTGNRNVKKKQLLTPFTDLLDSPKDSSSTDSLPSKDKMVTKSNSKTKSLASSEMPADSPGLIYPTPPSEATPKKLRKSVNRPQLKSSRKLFTSPKKSNVIPSDKENSSNHSPEVVKLKTTSGGSKCNIVFVENIATVQHDNPNAPKVLAASNGHENIHNMSGEDFDFDWPSDVVFQERESKAREKSRSNSNVVAEKENNNKSAEGGNICLPSNFKLKKCFVLLSPMKSEKVSKLDAKRVATSSDFDFDWPSDDVFLQRESKARAISRLNNMENEDEIMAGHIVNISGESCLFASEKLYPVFDLKKRRKETSPIKRSKSSVKNTFKKLKNKSFNGDKKEQYIIDAGQKEIGAKVCRTCNMVFTIGEEVDENLHSKYHNTYLASLKFPGWKKERIIGDFSDGRVILVRKEDPNFMLKKVEDIITIVNRDLGFPTGGLQSRPNAIFLLFISDEKRVTGCLVAESISSACRVVLDKSATNIVPCSPNVTVKTPTSAGTWCSSSETVRATCGISRIWVASDSRRKRIATRMVDCLRCHFVYGCYVEMNELAFSDPSLDGREFAAAYTQTDNFLVYK